MKKFLTIAATLTAAAGIMYLIERSNCNKPSETPINPSNDSSDIPGEIITSNPSKENADNDIDRIKAAIAAETFNVDLFIIPNKATTPDDYLGRSDVVRSELEHFLQVNGHKLEDEPEQIIVETWGVDKGHRSDNVRDHGIFMDVDDISVSIHPKVTNMPYRIIRDLKEGDTMQITVPTRVEYTRCSFAHKEFETEILINATAKQGEYRYRNWGTFEDALSHVIRHFC